MNDELIRKLPFSLLAEQSLLGAIMIDPESIREVADFINSEDFYLDEHKQIYLAGKAYTNYMDFLLENTCNFVDLLI